MADGSPNPRFEATLAGWLAYISTVTREVRTIVGDDDFDVEIWNELTFGSDFLDINRYYSPEVDTAPGEAMEVTTRAILERSVEWLRDPAHGVPGVGIGDGFASQRPWEAGSTIPVGLTAIDKHPYPRRVSYPDQAILNGSRPTDALGREEGSRDAAGRWVDSFTPSYVSYFPEYFLSAIQTEHMVRDLSPLTTGVYGEPHGRRTRPAGGIPPELWITELNLGSYAVEPAARERFQAKVALRSMVSFVAKGASAVDLFAAHAVGDGQLGLVDPRFFEALDGSDTYPGDAAGGLTLDATRRLVEELQGPPTVRPRRLSLLAIGDYADRTQFTGDGTRAHPPLFDREVAAVFPFQVDDDRFAVAAYVMTRDLGRVDGTACESGSSLRPASRDISAEAWRYSCLSEASRCRGPTRRHPGSRARRQVRSTGDRSGDGAHRLSKDRSIQRLMWASNPPASWRPDDPPNRLVNRAVGAELSGGALAAGLVVDAQDMDSFPR